jgi:hypothetical protein
MKLAAQMSVALSSRGVQAQPAPGYCRVRTDSRDGHCQSEGRQGRGRSNTQARVIAISNGFHHMRSSNHSNHSSTKAMFLNSSRRRQISTGLGDQGVAGSSPVSPTLSPRPLRGLNPRIGRSSCVVGRPRMVWWSNHETCVGSSTAAELLVPHAPQNRTFEAEVGHNAPPRLSWRVPTGSPPCDFLF